MLGDILCRPGRFEIKDRVIRDTPEIALKIMSQVIVVRCEFEFHPWTLKYVGYSMLFDRELDGREPASYEFSVTETESGEMEVKAIRRSE